jgi:hypothetical protein
VLKCNSWGDEHDGPISAVSLSPFNKDLILSVGGKVVAIWRDSIKVWNPISLCSANMLEVHAGRHSQFTICFLHTNNKGNH